MCQWIKYIKKNPAEYRSLKFETEGKKKSVCERENFN